MKITEKQACSILKMKWMQTQVARSQARAASLLDPTSTFNTLTMALNPAQVAVTVIISLIVAMIAFLIGVNLISPVATAVGGALKNGNLTGAANSLTAQLTLIFVTIVILAGVVFLAIFGMLAGEHTKE